MTYRPIADVWWLARCKYRDGSKRYGGYPGGFPERARALLGVGTDGAVLHVCGGLAPLYPYDGGYGPNDRTVDLDPAVEPDFLADVREALPLNGGRPWDAILADPPYSEEDSTHYGPGPDRYPAPMALLRNCLDAVRPGGCVGFLHYLPPQPPPGVRFVASVAVYSGFNNRVRSFSVYRRPATARAAAAVPEDPDGGL